jgi:hypothetical protein
VPRCFDAGPLQVAGAVMRGAMTVEKAWLMARTVVGVARAMSVMTVRSGPRQCRAERQLCHPEGPGTRAGTPGGAGLRGGGGRC